MSPVRVFGFLIFALLLTAMQRGCADSMTQAQVVMAFEGTRNSPETASVHGVVRLLAASVDRALAAGEAQAHDPAARGFVINTHQD